MHSQHIPLMGFSSLASVSLPRKKASGDSPGGENRSSPSQALTKAV